MGTASYQSDFAAWAFAQADLLRVGNLKNLDIANLVEEIEAMGRSEHRSLENRLILLIGHLLKWQFQQDRRGNSWSRTIREQRKGIGKLVKDSPSLKAHFDDDEWFVDIWDSAVSFAVAETDLDIFPNQPIWSLSQVLQDGWLPSEE